MTSPVEPSLSDLIQQKVILYLVQNSAFNKEVLEQIQLLAKTGRLSKPKEVSRVISIIEGTNENPKP